MNIENFVDALDADFFAGVPDSQLKALTAFLFDRYGISSQHVIAANEGNAVALAAGYHLATGKVPVVYLQNSGLGNIINPVASLLHQKVYGIPCLFIVGWRGEPGVHDEPQHIFQGERTIELLEQMQIPAFVIGQHTTEAEVRSKLEEYREVFHKGGQAAFVVRKNALEYTQQTSFSSHGIMRREEILSHILDAADENDLFVSTTGMASRELFELREARGQDHTRDFLTVGSMGHCSSIALGIALQKPERRVWCIDGDGSILMHMGALSVVGANAPKRFIHVAINNGSHESVGGMPTVAGNLELSQIAKACGYTYVACAADSDALDDALQRLKQAETLSFLEVKAATGTRKNLGRPTTSPIENKISFMNFLAGK